jgi:hypothetical protein
VSQLVRAAKVKAPAERAVDEIAERALGVARDVQRVHGQVAEREGVAIRQPVRARRNLVGGVAIDPEPAVVARQRAVASGVVPVVVRSEDGHDIEPRASVLAGLQLVQHAEHGRRLARVDERD